MIINYLTLELYPDTLEKFLRLALQDYVYKHKGVAVITLSVCTDIRTVEHYNLPFQCSTSGDVFLDVKFRFVDLVKKAKGKKVLYFPDAYNDYKSLFDDYGYIYDYIFFPANNSLIDNKRVFNLSVGYCPYTHYPIRRKKKIDVCFIGTKHEDRGWIAEIPKIELYGNGWGEGVLEAYGAKKREIVAQSKIMLNYHVDKNAANMRDYELLAMGAFVLSDYVPDCLKGGMVGYRDFNDLFDKLDYYLEHEKEREEIAMRGLELVAPYTYEKRCEEMLNIIVESGGIESD